MLDTTEDVSFCKFILHLEKDLFLFGKKCFILTERKKKKAELLSRN